MSCAMTAMSSDDADALLGELFQDAADAPESELVDALHDLLTDASLWSDE